jgi:hypothetical protein
VRKQQLFGHIYIYIALREGGPRYICQGRIQFVQSVPEVCPRVSPLDVGDTMAIAPKQVLPEAPEKDVPDSYSSDVGKKRETPSRACFVESLLDGPDDAGVDGLLSSGSGPEVAGDTISLL